MKTYTCPDCGGENVSQDAVARWSIATQEFEVSGFLDSFSCDDCEREIKHLEEREITEATRYDVQRRVDGDELWAFLGRHVERADADAAELEVAAQDQINGDSFEYRVIPVWPQHPHPRTA